MRDLKMHELEAVSGGSRQPTIVVTASAVGGLDLQAHKALADAADAWAASQFTEDNLSFDQDELVMAPIIVQYSPEPQEDWGPPDDSDSFWNKFGDDAENVKQFMIENPDYPLNDPAYREHVEDLDQATFAILVGIITGTASGTYNGYKVGGVPGAATGAASGFVVAVLGAVLTGWYVNKDN